MTGSERERKEGAKKGAERRRGRKGERRREQILDIAVEIFARHGYERTSIGMICEEAGIARGTLYQYFENKQDLFHALLDRFVQKFRSYMQPFPLQGIPLPRNREGIRLLLEVRLRRIFEAVAQDRAVFRLLLQEAVAR
ncbi:MAG: TetR/AcrR family transcriptional regulator, partial [Deltaproteobacteria bacterium]